MTRLLRGTRRARYRDDDGMLRFTLIPEGAPDSHAPMGVPIGPPSLEPLGLPEAMMKRLHNELAERELVTAADVRARLREVIAALEATFKVDALRILELYESAADKPEAEHEEF